MKLTHPIVTSERSRRRLYSCAVHAVPSEIRERRLEQLTSLVPDPKGRILSPKEIEVQAPPGTTIAYVRQRWSVCNPKFTVYDRKHKAALNIVGPFCPISLPGCMDVKFEEYMFFVEDLNPCHLNAFARYLLQSLFRYY
ncbi:hypothetical protein HPB48_009222 [Haemaphysalis longicornis]|uniref:Phospholipid scramblase n=1 Tax=Haemaphysalis longicornis TaxID=44386 RepID=A0A9J6G7G1_HAELO|nr:hypothetical protein HPB48_009222 [Haemaphysalis longicornis]